MAYVITGPTSGFGLRTALELARHDTVVLVGRNQGRLDEVRRTIEGSGGRAETVVGDVSEPASVQAAVEGIVALGLPLEGLLNNAGIMQNRATTNSLGWDLTFATDHLGPFQLTEALIPHLPDGAHVAFIVSAVEDPGRKPATMAGFRGGRFISVEAAARGEWEPGGSKMPGLDAYATAKQCALAATLDLARESPRLRISAIEPGFSPGTGLGRDSNVALQLIAKYLMQPLTPLIPYATSPKRAGRMIAGVMTDRSGATGVYYNEKGAPMRGSDLVHDPAFQARVVAETRAFLARVPD
jgi:NAD(P)-dependent dehydrogenase (short-subunit alcohol dehydrogenase family)